METMTSLADISSDIIQARILSLLDGPSLSNTSSVSSNLQSLCSDRNLWSHISKSTWPSITDPRVERVISTFSHGHRTFFHDSFPTLITDVKRGCSKEDSSSHPWTSELISSVDIRYQNDVIYSNVDVTNMTTDLLSSKLMIKLDDDRTWSKEVPGCSRSIDLTVDEIAGADKATLSHLRESVTLSWILINPTQKRACNLSSIKPISARKDWVTNETILKNVTILPGCVPNETVKCVIQLVLGVGKGGMGLHVNEVTLKLADLHGNSLNGRDFLLVTQRAIMEENNARRKVIVNDKERWKSYNVFKEIRREKKKLVKTVEQTKKLAIKFGYVGVLLYYVFIIYSLLNYYR